MPEPQVPPPVGAPRQPADPQLYPPPRRSSAGLILVAVLLACVAGGLGYYSLQLWQGQKAARAELRETKETVNELETERKEREEQGKEQEQRLSALQQELHATKATLTDVQGKLEELSEEREDIDARLRDYRAIAANFKRLIDSGRLKVELRRGRMVVDLPAQVLFPSGKAELSDEGGKALREVARILRKVRGKRFIVAGHTDNVKIQAKTHYSSNWALSAARAVTVTETLVRFGMRPSLLVAAGYGPHDPVARNRSAKGRQLNRRIEIILEPKLRELPKRLEKKL